jgi:16S rRNA (uracil1498-N3)-methyltransferase
MDLTSLRSTSAHVFVQPQQLDAEAPIELDDDSEHHLRRVLRLREGEVVSVTDGEGCWRLTSVVLSPNSLFLDPTSEVFADERQRDPLHLATAIPKGDRLDWLVQKVTELGADRITLLHAERSIVRWKPDRAAKQLVRLQRIADEACRQSRRVRRLKVEGPVDAHTILPSYVVAEPGGRRLASGDRSVAVGPEGGWSPSELDTAKDRVDLGSNILRTETAAIAITTLSVAFER